MLTLKVATDNAAFEADLLTEECARILRAVAERIEDCGGQSTGSIQDANGNHVGTWSLR
jgi:hypothetical protein